MDGRFFFWGGGWPIFRNYLSFRMFQGLSFWIQPYESNFIGPEKKTHSLQPAVKLDQYNLFWLNLNHQQYVKQLFWAIVCFMIPSLEHLEPYIWYCLQQCFPALFGCVSGLINWYHELLSPHFPSSNPKPTCQGNSTKKSTKKKNTRHLKMGPKVTK